MSAIVGRLMTSPPPSAGTQYAAPDQLPEPHGPVARSAPRRHGSTALYRLSNQVGLQRKVTCLRFPAVECHLALFGVCLSAEFAGLSAELAGLGAGLAGPGAGLAGLG